MRILTDVLLRSSNYQFRRSLISSQVVNYHHVNFTLTKFCELRSRATPVSGINLSHIDVHVKKYSTQSCRATWTRTQAEQLNLLLTEWWFQVLTSKANLDVPNVLRRYRNEKICRYKMAAEDAVVFSRSKQDGCTCFFLWPSLVQSAESRLKDAHVTDIQLLPQKKSDFTTDDQSSPC